METTESSGAGGALAGWLGKPGRPAIPFTPPGIASDVVAEPPVVARLVVEIRSDGTTTIARGGLTDVVSGQSTVIEARGSTPLSLAFDLCRSLVGLSTFGVRAARALLPRPNRSR
jgi:hypothetical protein